jgi:hypothetical protein
MNQPNDTNEPSPASDGSRRDACRAAFERWADEDGCLRTIKKTNGSYLDSPTRWAWDGWRAATLTDEEREALTYAAGSLLEQFIELGDKQDREMSDRVKAVIQRLK